MQSLDYMTLAYKQVERLVKMKGMAFKSTYYSMSSSPAASKQARGNLNIGHAVPQLHDPYVRTSQRLT